MRTLTFRPAAFLCATVSCMLIAAPASAQQPAGSALQLEPLSEEAAPAVTIRSNAGERQITETREQGRVTDVRVRSGDRSYTLKPNTPAGNSFPGDAQSNTTRAPQWQVMEFEWGGKQEDNPAAAEAVSAPPPPNSVNIQTQPSR